MSRQTDTDKLQKYLDEQILAFTSQQKQKPTFDNIQNKLLKIQQKLLSLKTYSQQNFTHHFTQQTSLPYPSSHLSINSSQVQLSPPKQQYILNNIQNRQDHSKPFSTPAKQLNIVSKTMSAGHIGLTQVNATLKKQKNKANTSAKKKVQTNQSLTHLGRVKEYKCKFTPIKSATKNSKSAKEPQRQVHFLKKELQNYQKTNKQLRRRMNQLKSYQTQFTKLKQIFDRCEQMRRRTHLKRKKI